jgi:cytochrome P450
MELYRRAAKDFELGGHAVPAGTAISIPLAYVSAHDPRWAGATGDLAPEVFNPDRMLRPEGRAPGDQMPFGYGSRYCLGAYLAQAEMKAFLALYAQRYSATCDPTTEWHYTIGRTPKNGLPTLMRELPPAAAVA